MSLSNRITELSKELANPFDVYVFEDGLDMVHTEISVVVDCVCPVLKTAEKLCLIVNYRAKGCRYIETHTFYMWLLSLRETELGPERLAYKVYAEIVSVIDPQHLTVEVNTGELTMMHRVTLSTDKTHWKL